MHVESDSPVFAEMTQFPQIKQELSDPRAG